MAVANGMHSVANARPTLCDMLPNELDTDIPAKPRRSISRAVSSVARRRPGSAIRLRAGKAAGMAGAPSFRMSGLIIARYLRRDRSLVVGSASANEHRSLEVKHEFQRQHR